MRDRDAGDHDQMTHTAAFVPAPSEKIGYRSVLKKPDVQILAGSRAAVKMGGSVLSSGAMVRLARIGSSQLQIASISSVGCLATLIFGLQGGMFGIQEVQENALSLVTVLVLGGVATIIGPEVVFVIAPIMVGLVIAMLLRYSFAATGQAEPTRDARRAFFTDDEHPLDAPAPSEDRDD